MVRDYVLIGDGWVKDGNFNTAFPTTIIPLPDHKMHDYVTPPTTLEDDPGLSPPCRRLEDLPHAVRASGRVPRRPETAT